MKRRTWSALVCLIVAALAFTATSFAQPQSIPRELARRFVGPNTAIFVGELPPKKRIGFDFPQPQKTRVVGANAPTNVDPSYNYVSLYFSSEQGVADVKMFYQQVFRKLGWRTGQTYEQIGFLPTGETELTDTLTFCHSQDKRGTDVYLTLGSHQQATLIDAQVSTYDLSQGSSACDENNYSEPPIPPLTAPEASTSAAVENLSGFGQGNGGSLIVLNTELSAQALLQHYAKQLEQSGWSEDMTAEGETVQVATYRFRSRDEAFVGTLQVLPLGQKRLLAQIAVVKP